MPTSTGNNPLDIALTGQLLLARPLHESRHGPFLELVELIRNADVAVAGFEGVMAGEGWPSPKATLHVAPESVAETLSWMGFRLVALAGNHAFDLGPKGIVHTIQVLSDHGLVTSGTGKDPEASRRAAFFHTTAGSSIALLSRQLGPSAPTEQAVAAIALDNLPDRLTSRPGVAHIGVERTVSARPEIFAALAGLLDESGHFRRRNERIAMGAESVTPNILDAWGTPVVAGTSNRELWHVDPTGLDDLLSRVSNANEEGGSAIVHFHNHFWASDPSVVPSWFTEMATAVATAGAPIVMGHGYPGLQALELKQGHLVAHGLGSLAFHTRRPKNYNHLRYWESVVVLARLSSERRCEKVELVPIVHGHHPCRTRRETDLGEPELADFEVGRAILERLGVRCGPFDSRIVVRRTRDRAVGELIEDASER